MESNKTKLNEGIKPHNETKMINVIGQYFGTSGYASHTRNLAKALDKIEPVRLITQIPQGWMTKVTDQELTMIKRIEKEHYDTNLIITHPMHWRSNAWAKKNIVYLVWEGDRVPWWIIEECFNDNIHKIIVPSTHTAKALEKTIEDHMQRGVILDKVALIPHGVDIEIFKPLPKASPAGEPNYKNQKPFKFLAVKGFRNLEDRGGIQYLIRAFAKEFKKDENVELIIKLNAAYGIPNVGTMFPELENNAPITIIHNELTDKQMNQLYNDCDVFVSPTRAEGFNIPCLEALSTGTPVITTGYGGQTDFCSIETGWVIDYDLVDVEHEEEYEGVQWATPKMEDLKSTMREAYKDKIHIVTHGVRGRRRAKKLTWDNTATQITKVLKTIKNK